MSSVFSKFESHVRSCFFNMAFPHLVHAFSKSNQDVLINKIVTRLFEEARKKAADDQKVSDPSNLDQDKAISDYNSGKLMRLLITVIYDFKSDLPEGYLNKIDQIAQNHLTTALPPAQNVASIFSSTPRDTKLQPTCSQEQSSPVLVCGAPGVGKSTYPEALFHDKPYLDTSTDIYANLLAAETVARFKVPANPDPYRIGGLEGALIKRRFIELMSQKLTDPKEQIPNIIISTVKMYGPELEGIFKSAIPNIRFSLLFCSEKTAISHMSKRAGDHLHNAPVDVIVKGLKDASNQLFSNENLLKEYQGKYKSVVHYLRQNCKQHRKSVVLDIVSSDPQVDQTRALDFTNTLDGKGFAIAAKIVINPDGTCQLSTPSDASLLNQFLAQSKHTIDDLKNHLNEAL